jgi:hypothetical protein
MLHRELRRVHTVMITFLLVSGDPHATEDPDGGIALIISISSFFWRLFPLIRKMDRADQIDPKNYSATLGLMISALVLVLVVALLLTGAG